MIPKHETLRNFIARCGWSEECKQEWNEASRKRAAGRFRKHGPGTELKKLLAKIGINAGGCFCNSHAREMDRKGPDWCEANMPTIIGWLHKEAEQRKLPFADFAGKILVRRAIANARR